MAFARHHAGRTCGIPATIAVDSGDYDRQRGYEVAAGYARAGGLLTSYAIRVRGDEVTGGTLGFALAEDGVPLCDPFQHVF